MVDAYGMEMEYGDEMGDEMMNDGYGEEGQYIEMEEGEEMDDESLNFDENPEF